MDSNDQPTALDPELVDRLTALEQRNVASTLAAPAPPYRAPLLAVLTAAGVGLAGVCLVTEAPVFAVLSAAALLVLLGMGQRGLAAVKSVALLAAAAVAFVLLPALREINEQTQQAVTNVVLTATSGNGLDMRPAYVVTGTAVAFPPFAVYDPDNDRSAELPAQ